MILLFPLAFPLASTMQVTNLVFIADLPDHQSLQLTFYETSLINDIPCFAITPIPISILNNAGPRPSCNEGVNPLQPLPQPSSDFGQSPFNPLHQVAISTGTTSGAGEAQTRTDPRSSPIESASTLGSVNSSPTSPPLPEDSPSKAPGSVTLVIVSQVVTAIADGQEGVVTTRFATPQSTTHFF